MNDGRIFNLCEGLQRLMYKGVSLDGVHVGIATGMTMEQSFEGTPKFTVEFVLDDSGVNNLIDYMKMMEVMGD